MTIQIYNTLTRRKEPFQPIEEGKVRMYVCGPTVYADAHIGHAMSAIIFDMVHRYLEYRGLDVTYATNFTDVDDKIINRANQTGQDPFELANHYAEKYLVHLRDLHVKEADVYPRVSTEIAHIIHMIQGLQESGYAYEMDNSVYFRVTRDEDYGKLSRRNLEEAVSGTRVAEDESKENVADFALWKAAKAGEPAWPSPWGEGRPGWHIECSAMCLHHLGETIDIHGGGNDLVFPHHENEIAQSESLTGHAFANVWMHNGMLQLAGEKMSKSLGNLITIDEFLTRYSADVLRMVIFGGHYRKPVVYNDETLSSARRSLSRLRRGLQPASGGQSTGDAVSTLREATENARVTFVQAMDDDFNTSSALAALFELVRAINSARTAGASGPFYTAAQKTLGELCGILGLTLEEEEASSDAENPASSAPLIDLLIAVRADLRTAKQWALADRVRDGLSELGILLEDGSGGTTWRRGEEA